MTYRLTPWAQRQWERFVDAGPRYAMAGRLRRFALWSAVRRLECYRGD